MSVTAIRPGYHGDMKDTVEHFHGKQLVSLWWDRHLMYATPLCVPLPPQMPFSALVEQVLPGLFGQHPDFAKVDWREARWQRDGQPFDPAMDRSLADNGIGHKAMLRFRTPGLDGLHGACF
jgi:phenol hydroxylase P4 protein